MVRQLVMNPLWIEPPAWLAINPKAPEESRESAEDFIYHRPVLQKEALELLKPKAGFLILDGTCGGGGHTEALIESGADVLALDQDPDGSANQPHSGDNRERLQRRGIDPHLSGARRRTGRATHCEHDRENT